MKLQHLPIGARFEYEGKVYVKSGPLTAVAEEGGSRVIPRYAVLREVGGAAAARPAGPAVDRAAALAAFETFYQACAGLVDDAAQEQLAAARQRFLAALGG